MPALFQKPPTGGPVDKFEDVEDGLYVGTLVRFEEGRPYVDRITGEETPKVNWVWELFDVSGTPILAVDGSQREVYEATSTKTGKGARSLNFFAAHLGRTIDARENMEDVQNECIGKSVMLNISTKPGEGAWRKIDVFKRA